MKTFGIVLLALLPTPAFARGSGHTRGYIRKSTGTYVAPSHHTQPNHTKADNYSTKGNENPYTGKKGTKSAD